jgi:hypothetical protein
MVGRGGGEHWVGKKEDNTVSKLVRIASGVIVGIVGRGAMG